MSIAGGAVVFIIMWWVVLFMTLSWRVRPNDQSIEGVPAGAPEKAYLKEKFIATTVITVILWITLEVLIRYEVLTYEIFI